MNILTGYLGLTMGFLVLVTLFLWILIQSNTKLWIKVVTIPIVLWYSLILFYTPGKLMGWPTPDPIPESALLLLAIIQEPSAEDDGAIYVWLFDDSRLKENKSIAKAINPKNVFDYTQKNTPRVHVVPYDEKLHKKIADAQQEAGENPAVGVRIKREGKGEKKKWSGNNPEDKIKIEIYNKIDNMPKDKVTGRSAQ